MTESDFENEEALAREDNSLILDRIEAAALEASVEGNIASHIRERRAAWTAEELGVLLNLSRKHIYKLAKTGRMPSYRLGGAIRFDPQATADWLEKKATG
jgi:excisionase family DNA binding protein